jgi:iron(III) transport system permease protein
MPVASSSNAVQRGIGSGVRRPPRSLVWGAVLIGVLFVSPVGYLLYQNIRLGSDLPEIWRDGTFGPLRRSLLLATSVAVSTAVVGTALAWRIVRTDTAGNRLWSILAPLPLVFPSFVGATALISGFARGGFLERVLGPVGVDRLPELQGFSGAWLVLTLFTYPYVYLPVAARLRRSSGSAEDGARMLGRSPASVFLTIVMPQLRGSISAGALLVFLYTISDFGAVQLLRYDTLTRAIYSNGIASPPTFYALALLTATVALIVVAIERLMVRRDPPAPAHVRQPSRPRAGRARWVSGAAMALFFSIALLGPAASLGFWVVRGARSSRQGGATALDSEGLGRAIINTVGVSVAAALVTVIVVLPIAYLTGRYRSRIGDATHALVVSGFALPGIVVALAFVFWVLRTPMLGGLYQTIPLLILSYVVRFGSQATRAASTAVTGISPRLDDAARTLGAGRWRRFATVDLPLMAPGLAAAVGLVLLSTMKELPATLFLRPSGFDTLTTRIWSSMEVLSYAQAGLDALVLLVVSALLTWVLVIRPAR